MNYDLVIFDCDGVLVDSERITSRVFCDMLAELGLELTQEEMFQRFVGQAWSLSRTRWADRRLTILCQTCAPERPRPCSSRSSRCLA